MSPFTKTALVLLGICLPLAATQARVCIVSNFGYVKFEVETGASPGWSPMVIYKGALVNIWLKG